MGLDQRQRVRRGLGMGVGLRAESAVVNGLRQSRGSAAASSNCSSEEGGDGQRGVSVRWK